MSIEGKFVLNKMMIIEVMGLLSKMLSSLITLPPFKVPTQDRRRPLSLTDSLLVCSITIVAAGINNLLLAHPEIGWTPQHAVRATPDGARSGVVGCCL